ncbi:MAG: hypothetical protein KJP06_03165 [Deltaproteobacteria bacterium]|nr:hypothetical protein [Deltaproteobacteria bacterium]
MPVKFNQYWSVDFDKNEDYEKYIIRKFIPGMNKLGIHIVAGWTVLVGGNNELFLEGISNDLDQLENALRDKKYRELNADLQNYVRNYKTKVLVDTGKKDDYSKDVKANTVKFNQAWNIISKTKDQYEEYVIQTFYPCLEELGIKVASEWEVFIGEGPHILCEGRAQDIDTTTLISNLRSEKFQKAKHGLMQFIESYESRIFIFHIQKIIGYKSASYEMVSF